MKIRSVKNKPNSIQHYKYVTASGKPDKNPLNGVSPTFWVYELNPNIENLSPLALFLFENLKGIYVGRGMNHPSIPNVICYNGKTEADLRRAETVENSKERDLAEKYIKCYDLENVKAKIDGWLFRYINLNESDDDYLNSVANEMIKAGSLKIKILDNVYEIN